MTVLPFMLIIVFNGLSSVLWFQYVEDLGCPYSISQKNAVLDWLMGYAVRLEYGDDGKEFFSIYRKLRIT